MNPQAIIKRWVLPSVSSLRRLHDSQAVAKINPSVSKSDIARHEAWLKEFGSL